MLASKEEFETEEVQRDITEEMTLRNETSLTIQVLQMSALKNGA